MYPTEGILVHTNHFIAFVPEQIAATYRPFSVNSLWRLDRLKRGLEAVRDAKDSAGVYQAIVIALRDHFGYPNSLCKHDDARLGTGDRYHTIAMENFRVSDEEIVDGGRGQIVVQPTRARVS